MEHRCRRGQFCPDNEKMADGTRLGRTINAADGLCDTCERHVEKAIAHLPSDYVELNTILGHGSTVGGEPIRMTREAPIPIRVHVEALQRDIVLEATQWAASVADVLGTTWDWGTLAHARPGWLLDKACSLLAGAPSALLALRDAKHEVWEHGQRYLAPRDGLDGALILTRLHHRTRALTGKQCLVNKLPVPCPRCEHMTLEREDGQDCIDCVHCARRYTWAEYEKLCMILVGRREVAA